MGDEGNKAPAKALTVETFEGGGRGCGGNRCHDGWHPNNNKADTIGFSLPARGAQENKNN